MNTSLFYLIFIIQANQQSLEDLNRIVSILTIGFATILILLSLTLFKAYKLKKNIKFLEEQLNNSK